jgi:hypothetical protein
MGEENRSTGMSDEESADCIQSNHPSSQNSSALSVDIETMANNIESVGWTRSSRMTRNLTRRMSTTGDLPAQITTELTSSPTSSKRTN